MSLTKYFVVGAYTAPLAVAFSGRYANVDVLITQCFQDRERSGERVTATTIILVARSRSRAVACLPPTRDPPFTVSPAPCPAPRQCAEAWPAIFDACRRARPEARTGRPCSIADRIAGGAVRTTMPLRDLPFQAKERVSTAPRKSVTTPCRRRRAVCFVVAPPRRSRIASSRRLASGPVGTNNDRPFTSGELYSESRCEDRISDARGPREGYQAAGPLWSVTSSPMTGRHHLASPVACPNAAGAQHPCCPHFEYDFSFR
jgi:hypothetical protein